MKPNADTTYYGKLKYGITDEMETTKQNMRIGVKSLESNWCGIN